MTLNFPIKLALAGFITFVLAAATANPAFAAPRHDTHVAKHKVQKQKKERQSRKAHARHHAKKKCVRHGHARRPQPVAAKPVLVKRTVRVPGEPARVVYRR